MRRPSFLVFACFAMSACTTDQTGLGEEITDTGSVVADTESIPDTGSPDTSTVDSTVEMDSGVDSTIADTGADSAMDSGIDSTMDSTVDSAMETATDTSMESAVEASVDSAADTMVTSTCGSAPLADWTIDLKASDSSATPTAISAPACTGFGTLVTSGTPGSMKLQESIDVYLVGKTVPSGFFDTYGPVLQSTSSGGTVHMELIKMGSSIGAGVDATHAVVFVFAQTHGTTTPCNTLDKITYTVTGGATGATIQYLTGGVPSSATETDASGNAIIIVPTTGTAASPQMIQIAASKAGCDTFFNVGGVTGDIPTVAGATGNALIDVEDMSL